MWVSYDHFQVTMLSIPEAALHKNWSFLLWISSVNMNKSAGNFPEEILNGKLHFLCSADFLTTNGF